MTGAQVAALLKKNGWVLNLLFIFLGAYMLAGATNSVVASSIRVVPTADDMRRGRTAPKARVLGDPSVTYTSMAARNLLGAERENLQPVLEDAGSVESTLGTEFNESELRPCTMAGTVRATLVAEGAPEWSVAVIYDNAKRHSGVYSINEGSNEINADTTLVDVRSREVIVRRRDHYERCLGEGEGGAATRSSVAVKASSR